MCSVGLYYHVCFVGVVVCVKAVIIINTSDSDAAGLRGPLGVRRSGRYVMYMTGLHGVIYVHYQQMLSDLIGPYRGTYRIIG